MGWWIWGIVKTGDMLADGLTKALPLPAGTENFIKPWGYSDPGYDGAWDLFQGLARGRSSGGVFVWFGPGGRQSRAALHTVIA